MDGKERSGVDFWSIFFSILSLILFNFALFLPEQRVISSGFTIISIIIAIIVFYANKINYNEKSFNDMKQSVSKISDELKERFNYMRELQQIKMELEMLKKKRGNMDFLDLAKIIVAGILLYVIFTFARQLFG